MDEICVAVEEGLRADGTGVVAVSGFGGSGKSTLASELGRWLGAPVVGMDEFGTAEVFSRSCDWYGLDRGRLVRQVLRPLRDEQPLVTYDSCDDWGNWHTKPVTIAVDGALVLEGIGLFHPDLQAFLDFRIWLDVDLGTATRQGMARELAAGRHPGGVWRDVWEPNEADFFAKYSPKATANLIVRWL
jgi:uridine kinase